MTLNEMALLPEIHLPERNLKKQYEELPCGYIRRRQRAAASDSLTPFLLQLVPNSPSNMQFLIVVKYVHC